NPILPHSSTSLTLGDGYLNYDRQQNAFIELKYGNYASTPMNLDVTPNGADRFRLTLSAAPGQFSLAIVVQDNSFFQTEKGADINGNGPGTYDLSFTAFPGVEFNKLGGIRIFFYNGQ